MGVAEQQLAMMVNEHNSKQGRADQRSSSLAKLLRALAKPTGYKPVLLLTAIFVFQQFSGIYITIFYTVSFFKEVATSIDPHVSTVGVAIVRLIMGIITSFLLKSFGRRPLFMLSSAGMAIFVFISGYFTKEVMEGNMEKSLIPVICIWLYMSVGVVGFLNIPWTMTAEMFTIEVRGMAQGLMIAIAHMIMFAVLKIYPFLGEMLGGSYAVQWMFAACCSVSVVFFFIFLPETHKKQLGEIQEYFNENTIYILSRKTVRQENVIPVLHIDEEATKLKDPV